MFNVKPEVGRYNATFSIYLKNAAKMNVKSHKGGKGFTLNGEIRDFIINNEKLIIARNSDSLALFKY